MTREADQAMFFDKFDNIFRKKQDAEKTGNGIHTTVGEEAAPKGFTIDLNQPLREPEVPDFCSFTAGVSGNAPQWPEPKMPDVSEEEKPEFLTRDMGLGGHHVNGGHIHISMSVSYVAESHTVVYRHSSSQDPEEKKIYPIPPEVRTKAQLLWYLERKTDIPSVCWHYY